MKTVYRILFLTSLAIFPHHTRAGNEVAAEQGDEVVFHLEDEAQWHAGRLELIQKLEQRSKFQEAQWISRETRNLQKVEELQLKLSLALSTENFRYKYRNRRRGDSVLGGGLSYIFSFNSDIAGIFKADRIRFSNPISWIKGNTDIADAYKEVAAYVIDQLFELNLVPYTTFYKASGMLGSLQAYIKDMEVAPSLHVENKLDEAGKSRSLVASQKGEIKNWILLLILDYLMDNSDRKGENLLLWEEENRVIAIDHGLTFSNQGFYKHVQLKSCIFSLGRGDFEYVGFRDLSLDLNESEVPETVRQKLLTTSTKEVKKALSSLLNGTQLTLLLTRLSEIQRCLELHK